MQPILRWRNLLIVKNSFFQSTAILSTSKSQLVAFHSTRVSPEEWRNKWTSAHQNWNPAERSSQTPSKTYIKYKVRVKRADAKKALKNLLFSGGCSNVSFKETYTATLSDEDEEDPLEKKDRSKSSHGARRPPKARHKRMRRKLRENQHLYVDDEENVFQESSRKRWYKRSSRGGAFYQSSTAEFDFENCWNWSYRKHRESDIESDSEPDTERCASGTNSEREVLGLPLYGPLNIQDVKNAFRLSALKWHPDKHQGPSQAVAEEKFKLCVDAYSSLCKSLSSAA